MLRTSVRLCAQCPESLPQFNRPGQIVDLPLPWPVPGWEDEVIKAFEVEWDVLIAQHRRTDYDAEGNYIAAAAAEEAAGLCDDCAI